MNHNNTETSRTISIEHVTLEKSDHKIRHELATVRDVVIAAENEAREDKREQLAMRCDFEVEDTSQDDRLAAEHYIATHTYRS